MKTILVNLLSDPIVWALLFAVVLMAIGLIVKKTKSPKDDEVYAKILLYINTAFNVAEKAIPDTTTGKLSKLDIALKDFCARYEARFGESAPAELIDKAKAEWAVLAEELKKAKA